MNLFLDEGGVRLSEIDEVAAMLIRELPALATSDDERAESRLFQSPTQGRDEELDSEWRDSIEPGLRELFAEAVDLVVEDLAGMKEDAEEGLCFSIPKNHIDAWIHTLNRTRLSLGAIWGVTEDDMSGRLSAESTDPERLIAIFKIDFYGRFLEFLVWTKSN